MNAAPAESVVARGQRLSWAVPVPWAQKEWWALRDSRGLRVFGAIWGQKETQEISDRRVSAGIPAPWAPKATAAP